MNNVQRICRLCAKMKSNNMKNLFSAKYSNYLSKIEKITGVEFKNLSHLPQFICRQCREDLRQVSAFRSRWIKAQHHFTTSEYSLTLKLVDELKRIETNIHENEHQSHVTPVTDDAVENNQVDIEILGAECDDFYVITEEVLKENVIKEEVEFLPIPVNKREPLNNSAEYVRIENDDVIYDEVNFEIVQCAPGSENKVNCNAADKNEKKSENQNIVSKVPGRKRKNVKPPRNLICDQCGSVFHNNNHFETHLNKHRGFRPYECEYCPSKFFTKTELKGHRRIHTGERPYGCKYCDRRFLNSSKRGAHEKTHSGERPHKCTHCEKKFISKRHLRHHMVVHSDERRFCCTICNKFYKRRTELRNHKRSKEHQINEEMHDNTEMHLQIEN